MPAELVGTDPLSDIAILKLSRPTPRTFPVAQFGDVVKLKVGERVLALGSPLALSQSVTMGIVSNTEMIMPGMFWPFNRMTLDGEDVGSIVRWIGHDAPIFGGNSGGPLVNMNGEIVGVNEISLGLAGAIPADLAREVAEAIITDGRVKRSWMGLEVQPLLQVVEGRRGRARRRHDRRLAGRKGRLPVRRHPAALGGQPVTVRFAEEVPLFNQAVMRLPIGKPVQVTVEARRRREDADGHDRSSARASRRRCPRSPSLGITASNLTTWSAKELNRASRDGRSRARHPAGRPGRRGQAVAAGRRRHRRGGREGDAGRRGADDVARAGRRRTGRTACRCWSGSSAPASGC